MRARLLAAGCMAAFALTGARALAAEPGQDEHPGLPAERPPAAQGPSSLWRVRVGLGGTTMRLGGIEHFADASVDRIKGYAAQTFGAAAQPTERKNINFGLLEAVEASFQVDPLVCVAVKVGAVRSQRGSLHTVAGTGATRFDDTWEFSGDMFLLMGGAGFNLPLADRTVLNITLFLGAGFATADLAHRTDVILGGVHTVYEGTAEGTGSAFIPEFTMEIERELTESLAIGAGLGYRFGGIETFESRYATTLDPFFSNQPQFLSGWPVRNTIRAPLSADYGGLILVLVLTARG